jgi:hypothetical protein
VNQGKEVFVVDDDKNQSEDFIFPIDNGFTITNKILNGNPRREDGSMELHPLFLSLDELLGVWTNKIPWIKVLKLHFISLNAPPKVPLNINM